MLLSDDTLALLESARRIGGEDSDDAAIAAALRVYIGQKDRTRTPEQRFWSMVRKTETCWVWVGSLADGRYGQFRLNGRESIRAHRYSWELHYGSIPAPLEVLHSCDNTRCVRPSHLSLGTHHQNMQDMSRKGRGNGRGNPKLSESTVRAIRSDFANGGTTYAALAKKYGTTGTNVRFIVTHATWRQLP